MSCDITEGRIVKCKDSLGGLDKVYFINAGDLDPADITYGSNGDTIASITGTQHAYEYDLKGVSTFTQNIQSSRENGTTVFEQVLELTLPNLSPQDHKEIKLLAYGNPHVIVKDNNSNFFLMGHSFGADVTGGTVVTGGGMPDMSGYTLSLSAMEVKPANYFDSTTEATLATACGLIIVKGDGTFIS